MYYYLIKHTQLLDVNIPTRFIHTLSCYRKTNDYIKYIERQYIKSLRSSYNRKTNMKQLFKFIHTYGINNIDVVIINCKDIEYLSKDYIFIGR